MFVEIHNANTTGQGPTLAFLKSLNVQAFPCGRRRSELVDFDDQNRDGQVKTDEQYYIPYDPEARLNTEANNRQHSSINGFSQNFIKSFDFTGFSVVIGGYLFKVKTQYSAHDVENTFADAYDALGKTLIQDLQGTTNVGDSIYANIRIEEVPLYSGFTTYYTGILRDQTQTGDPSASIDKLISSSSIETIKAYPEDCFYFAGLSFSTEPLAGNLATGEWYKETPIPRESDGGVYQRVISIKLLNATSATRWTVHEPALLPDIKHGPEADSIDVGTVYADKYLMEGKTVPSVSLKKKQGTSNTFKLSFSTVTNSEVYQ